MSLDHSAIKDQFPALALQDNGQRRIYLDNPAGTQVPESVVRAIASCLRNANANIGGHFTSSVAATAIVEDAHEAMADLLNARSAAEIIFGPNMTTLTLQISRALGRTFKPGDEIIVTEMDHDANVTPWVLLARDHGLTIRKIPLDTTSYKLDYEQYENMLSDRTRLVCVGHASNLLGTINDIRRITERAHHYGALVFVDAVHSVPHIPVDVTLLGCDLLACSPYKFFGPHQGVLWGRQDLLESLEPYKLVPVPDSVPGCFETGTQNHEAMAGVTAAVDYLASLTDRDGARRDRLRTSLELIRDYEHQLCQALIQGLNQIEGLKIHGISATNELLNRVPTVSFTLRHIDPESIAGILSEHNIFAWSGHSYAVEPCKAMGVLQTGGVLRVGLVHYNTTDDIEALLEVLRPIAAQKQDWLSA
ncbi:MAG: cysteine desulfurase-like protein [Gammaproteobacteria bacterium]|nr:cysteine desulfurase-like protein [Gammaproteobacteria bacterium]